MLLPLQAAAVALLYSVPIVTGLDTAGSIAAAVGANQCNVVQGIVSNLPSTAISSAQAFCNVYVTAKLQTMIVPGPTTTVRVAGICSAPSSPPQASKRELEKRGFVRSPAALCPTFLTALGTSVLSKACSCLTQIATTVTASTSTVTLTTYTPVLTTTTRTFTVTPTASTVYSTAVSSRILTSTTTSVVSATSVKQAIISSTAYSTSTAQSVATVVVLPSPISTATATYTTVVISTQTVLTTIVVVKTSTALQKRALTISTPAPTGCFTSTITVSTTVTAPRSTTTVPVQSVNDRTTQQIAVSTITTTVTSTQVTTVTVPTTVTIPTTSTSISGFVASASTLVTFSSTSTLTVSSTTTSTTVQQSLQTNLVKNPSFEQSTYDPSPWIPNYCYVNYFKQFSATGVNSAVMVFVRQDGATQTPNLSQQITSPYLANGGRVRFQYSWASIYADANGVSGVAITCFFTGDWNGVVGFRDAITIPDASQVVNPFGYKEGSFVIPPSTALSGRLNFIFACSSPGNGGTNDIDAYAYLDDVSLTVTIPNTLGR